MTEVDRRIAQLEIDLAQIQTTDAYCQLEANLVRQKLKTTLQIAMNFLARAADDFEMAHDGMVDRLSDRDR